LVLEWVVNWKGWVYKSNYLHWQFKFHSAPLPPPQIRALCTQHSYKIVDNKLECLKTFLNFLHAPFDVVFTAVHSIYRTTLSTEIGFLRSYDGKIP
jgi:hypothetical protein